MAAGFVLAFILLAWSSYALAEQKRNRIIMGMGKVWTAPAVIVGDDRGIFRKHGVQVEWKFFSNPSQVVEGIIAKAFIAGYLEAIKETKQDLKSTLADWSAFAGIGLIKTSPGLPYLPDDGKIDLEFLKTDMGLLQQFGYVKAIPRLEDIVDHSLIDEVLAGR